VTGKGEERGDRIRLEELIFLLFFSNVHTTHPEEEEQEKKQRGQRVSWRKTRRIVVVAGAPSFLGFRRNDKKRSSLFGRIASYTVGHHEGAKPQHTFTIRDGRF